MLTFMLELLIPSICRLKLCFCIHHEGPETNKSGSFSLVEQYKKDSQIELT